MQVPKRRIRSSEASTASQTASTRSASCSTASHAFGRSATTCPWRASSARLWRRRRAGAYWQPRHGCDSRPSRAGGWSFERKVAAGERRERTLEVHPYHLDRHLLPPLAPRLIREITVQDVAELLDRLRARGCGEKTVAGALATLNNILRFAVRNSWIAANPIEKLETYERPRPPRHPQRALGPEEITRLLDACLPQYRTLIASGLLTGMRISELLGLTWNDVDLVRGRVCVRAQLSRARGDAPRRRVAPKTRTALRQIPLAPQLGALLREHRAQSKFGAGSDWVFSTRTGTPLSQRNVQRSALSHAASAAGLLASGARLRFHEDAATLTPAT